jgi:hypothetical protein
MEKDEDKVGMGEKENANVPCMRDLQSRQYVAQGSSLVLCRVQGQDDLGERGPALLATVVAVRVAGGEVAVLWSTIAYA